MDAVWMKPATCCDRGFKLGLPGPIQTGLVWLQDGIRSEGQAWPVRVASGSRNAREKEGSSGFYAEALVGERGERILEVSLFPVTVCFPPPPT